MVGVRLAMMDLRKCAAVVLAAALILPLNAVSPADAASFTKRKKVRVQKQPPAPQAFRWRPADPSFDQNGRLYKPPPGLPCPVDLGYGRWTSCLWDD
jgi:hypothetical protein